MDDIKKQAVLQTFREAVACAREKGIEIITGGFWLAHAALDDPANADYILAGCCPISAVYLCKHPQAQGQTVRSIERGSHLPEVSELLGVPYANSEGGFLGGFYTGFDSGNRAPMSLGLGYSQAFQDGYQLGYAFYQELHP